jgi:23S rRNA pseudouridine1911/1915/1917 synthase
LSAPSNIQLSVLNSYNSLDDFLIGELSFTKSFVKKNFSNKERKRPIRAHQAIELPINLLNRNMISPYYKGSSYKIIFENDLIIALAKPFNSHSLSHTYADQNTSSAWLRCNDKSAPLLTNLGEMNRGLLNRLDFETSGVLVYAKDDIYYAQFRSNFDRHFIHKEYFAVVSGEIKTAVGLRNHLISKGENKNTMIVSEDGMLAECEVNPLKFYPKLNQTLVRVILKTGVRHQIRVQLANIGHPIVGDSFYGGPESDRLYLHAYKYLLRINNEELELVSADLEGQFFNVDCTL